MEVIKRSLDRWFIFFIIIWTILQSFYLNRAFYWDEAWVYAPALRLMAENGPSMLPDAIPEFYSRGHPLLFHFFGGAWLSVFGNSFISYHVFGLLISLIFLIVLYFTFKEWGGSLLALINVLFIGFNKTFFAEAANVTPEVMLALFGFLSIKYFINFNAILYFLFAAAAVLTKETGIIVPAVTCLSFLIITLIQKKSVFSAHFIKNEIILGSPILIFILFMFVQFQFKGWLLFPEHTGMIQYSFPIILSKLREIIKWIFLVDFKFLLSGAILFGIFLKYSWKSNNFYYIFSAIITFLILIHFDTNLWILFVFGIAFLLFTFWKIYENNIIGENIIKWPIYLTSGVFILIYLIFSAMNYFTIRYLIILLPFCLFLLIIASNFLFQNQKKYFYLIVGLSLCFTIISNFRYDNVGSLINQNDYTELRSELLRKLESKSLYEKNFGVPDFVIRRTMEDANIGILSGERIFKHVSWDIKDKDYIILNNFDQYPNAQDLELYKLIEKLTKGIHWIEIWEKIEK